MHQEVQEFVGKVRQLESWAFMWTNVVELGSLNINGSVRDFFKPKHYIGVDLGAGPGVDVICFAHEYEPTFEVDVVVSTEMLEHDEHWMSTLRHAYKMLRPGGLLLITCATDGRGEHGTTRASPADSPFTVTYYHNISPEEFQGVLPEEFFERCGIETGFPGDLRFYGVKRRD